MSARSDTSLLAIDVGSSRIKLGWFPAANPPPSKGGARGGISTPIVAPLPTPAEQFQVQHKERPADVWLTEIDDWLASLPVDVADRRLVASVHAGAAEALGSFLHHRRALPLTPLAAADLPLTVRLAEPHRVGIDRLLGAVAANRLRSPQAPAITVSLGTAITVNLISPDGVFQGGAILAGKQLALTALHQHTASLPFIDAATMTSPGSPVGTNTSEAMVIGAQFGTIGAIRELVARMAALHDHPPEVFLTGGGASNALAQELNASAVPVRHVPHLVLAGIRLAADCL